MAPITLELLNLATFFSGHTSKHTQVKFDLFSLRCGKAVFNIELCESGMH